MRNIIAENIESQVNSNLPMPKVTARRKKDEHLAKLIEDMIRNELNRMPFADAPEFTEFFTEAVALFDGNPGMCTDRIAIQCLDGVMNITNISGEDITEDIFVYYKNYIDGVYCGGITYRLRLTGGLKAGEIRQGSAAHVDRENSRIVFVTCGG